ncbi:MAG TPA: YraN family protein [Acidobacteriota bacterium]|nr:YraN family protein [Acidobacteriota bacterium]
MCTPFSEGGGRAPGRKVSRGRVFEQRAARYYQDNGFEILERNWHAGHKELDLIVRKADLIVFVEVKSGSSRRFGHPAERVDGRKISNLIDAARRFLIDRNIEHCDLRFDVVTFVDGELEHFPDAFRVE